MNPTLNSGDPEGSVVPGQHVTTVVLLLLYVMKEEKTDL
jgi:hypothetical protein